jgi:hypothetical protein
MYIHAISLDERGYPLGLYAVFCKDMDLVLGFEQGCQFFPEVVDVAEE